ncbi:hypothetical protein [uncultured Clostridium sp.]|uniref:hypothetical protein n=1 Tax=uncultured Clostridium sp. TaxID=59620 RepID=UPI002622D9DE|nr:hypothetical protein [uncultured Clostridium sp.]
MKYREKDVCEMYASEMILKEIVDVKGKVLEFFENMYNQEELTRVCKKLKFFSIDKEIEYKDLIVIINEANKLNKCLYTKKTWRFLENDIEITSSIEDIKNITKSQALELKEKLRNSIESLVEIKGKANLEELIRKAEKLSNRANLTEFDYIDAKWENFICAKEYAKVIFSDMDITAHFVEVAYSLLENSINGLFIKKPK